MLNGMLQRSESTRDGVIILLTNILIVDDDAGIRKMLTSVLSDEGYVVEAVQDGKEAINACERSPFDVALIDVVLPDTQGTELLNSMKKIRPEMVRIIITGHPSLESAMKAVNEKADGYILKPFEVTELLEKIRKKRILDLEAKLRDIVVNTSTLR